MSMVSTCPRSYSYIHVIYTRTCIYKMKKEALSVSELISSIYIKHFVEKYGNRLQKDWFSSKCFEAKFITGNKCSPRPDVAAG